MHLRNLRRWRNVAATIAAVTLLSAATLAAAQGDVLIQGGGAAPTGVQQSTGEIVASSPPPVQAPPVPAPKAPAATPAPTTAVPPPAASPPPAPVQQILTPAPTKQPAPALPPKSPPPVPVVPKSPPPVPVVPKLPPPAPVLPKLPPPAPIFPKLPPPVALVPKLPPPVPLVPKSPPQVAKVPPPVPATRAPITAAPTAAPVAMAPAPGQAPGGFVRAVGTKFADASCNSFNPIGWNAWHLVESTTGSAATPLTALPDGQDFLDYTFQTAASAGFNTFRFFAFGDNDDNRDNNATYSKYALQRAPGVYNETVFRAIDQVLAKAATNNLKVIVSVIDNWKLIDGVLSYISWCTNETPPTNTSDFSTNVQPFFATTACQTLYKNHVQTLINRRNTVNGRIYRADPTIFAWDLYNEPRCQPDTGCQAASLQSWISMMAAYFKSLDSNHMLTVGEEGFFGPNSDYKASNPAAGSGATWPQQTGQDFVSNHQSPNIDFGAIHLWPDRWTEMDPSFAGTWISAHEAAARALGKPLLLEEFGKLVPRDSFYTAVYTRLRSAFQDGGALQGALFWLLRAVPTTNVDYSQDYSVTPTNATWNIIKTAAAQLDSRPPSRVQGCTVGGPPQQLADSSSNGNSGSPNLVG